jgi:predicted lipoprotein
VELLEVYGNFFGGFDNSFSQQGDLTGYSVDSTTIENNITSGSYDLTTYSRSNFYSQGFPALSYLLVGPNAINKFSANTANRKKYIRDVTARLKTIVDKINTGWSSFGASFISNTKTDVGSSIGNLINQFAYQMDALKGPKIGWPFGKQSNGIVFATKTEAYFNGISVELIKANVAGLKNAFTGGAGNKGLSGYLVSLKQETLNNDVLAQFVLVTDKVNAIPDPLSTSLTAQASSVEAAYKEIQKLLTLLKTDVASATGVQITFMDNDGD